MAYKEAKHIYNFQGVGKKFASFCHVELFLPLIRVFLNLVILTLCPLSQNLDSQSSSFHPLATFHSPLTILSPSLSLVDYILTSLSVILHIWLEQNNDMKVIRQEAQQDHSFKMNSIHIPTSAVVLSPYGLVRIRNQIGTRQRKSQRTGWFYFSSNMNVRCFGSTRTESEREPENFQLKKIIYWSLYS